MSDYFTLQKEAQDEFIENRSRFIGYAKPVSTKEEAEAFIREIRAKHWDATHNVYAYVLRDGQSRRYSDDGEPSGTAGVPVLDVLLKKELTDCVVVATRYFGGILLGAGGLVRAYSHTSKIAVEAAGIVRMSVCCAMQVVCDYGFYTKLSAILTDFGATGLQSDFGEKVTVNFYLPKEKVPRFQETLTEASFGKCSAQTLGEQYAPTEMKD